MFEAIISLNRLYEANREMIFGFTCGFVSQGARFKHCRAANEASSAKAGLCGYTHIIAKGPLPLMISGGQIAHRRLGRVWQ